MNKITIDCIIGIDPGKTGGIAVWRPNHKTEVIKMPGDLMELRQWFNYMKSENGCNGESVVDFCLQGLQKF